MIYFKLQEKGFTLIEMLVAVAIFSIIIGAIIGVFVSAVRTQKYCLAAQQLLDQTSYAMEYMSRSIRMAKKDLVGDCVLPAGKNYNYIPGLGLMFRNYDSIKCKGFYLYDGRLYDYERNRASGESLPLTSAKANMEVKNFNINLLGPDQPPTDLQQPRVTFLLEIESKKITPSPKIKIQTTVSQRDLDFQE